MNQESQQSLRAKIWHAMLSANYRALYLEHFISYIRTADKVLSGFSILLSSGSIGGWLIWQEHPWLWAILIGLGQIFQLLRPVLPWIKDLEDLSMEKLLYKKLHLDYERAWEEARDASDPRVITDHHFRLKSLEVDMLRRFDHFTVPDWERVHRRMAADWKHYLFYQNAPQNGKDN